MPHVRFEATDPLVVPVAPAKDNVNNRIPEHAKPLLEYFESRSRQIIDALTSPETSEESEIAPECANSPNDCCTDIKVNNTENNFPEPKNNDGVAKNGENDALGGKNHLFGDVNKSVVPRQELMSHGCECPPFDLSRTFAEIEEANLRFAMEEFETMRRYNEAGEAGEYNNNVPATNGLELIEKKDQFAQNKAITRCRTEHHISAHLEIRFLVILGWCSFYFFLYYFNLANARFSASAGY